MSRLCAPLSADTDWRRHLATVRSLGIGAVELVGEWGAAEVAALAGTGVRVAIAPAPADLAMAPPAVDSLLLPPGLAAGDGDGTRALFAALADAAEARGVTLLLQNDARGWPADGVALGRFVAAVGRPGLRACYDPAQSVGLRRHPFLTDLMPGSLKRFVHCLRLRDAVFSDGAEVLPDEGNAELKELVSALECRGYQGWYALSPFGAGPYDERLTAAHAAARSLLDSF